MIQGLIFDMDGLLLDTEKLLTRYWMQAAHEAGFPMELEHVLGIRSLAAELARKKLQGIFGDQFDYDAIRDRRRELTAAHLAAYGIERKPGVLELLDFAHTQGLRCAVATATDRGRTMQYLSQTGLVRQFDALVCGDMVHKGKPDPEIYLTAANALELSPKVCMAFEDSPNGIRSAHAAGCSVVMIPDLSEPEEAILPLLTACVPTLADVIPILKGVNHAKA